MSRFLKGDLGNLILETYKLLGKVETIEALDRLKEMGLYGNESRNINWYLRYDNSSGKEARIEVARKEIDKKLKINLRKV